MYDIDIAAALYTRFLAMFSNSHVVSILFIAIMTGFIAVELFFGIKSIFLYLKHSADTRTAALIGISFSHVICLVSLIMFIIYKGFFIYASATYNMSLSLILYMFAYYMLCNMKYYPRKKTVQTLLVVTNVLFLLLCLFTMYSLPPFNIKRTIHIMPEDVKSLSMSVLYITNPTIYTTRWQSVLQGFCNLVCAIIIYKKLAVNKKCKLLEKTVITTLLGIPILNTVGACVSPFIYYAFTCKPEYVDGLLSILASPVNILLMLYVQVAIIAYLSILVSRSTVSLDYNLSLRKSAERSLEGLFTITSDNDKNFSYISDGTISVVAQHIRQKAYTFNEIKDFIYLKCKNKKRAAFLCSSIKQRVDMNN